MYTILDITRVYVQYVQHIVQTIIDSYCFQKLYKNLRGGIITTDTHDSPRYPLAWVLAEHLFNGTH